jgi:hypothetical protein
LESKIKDNNMKITCLNKNSKDKENLEELETLDKENNYICDTLNVLSLNNNIDLKKIEEIIDFWKSKEKSNCGDLCKVQKNYTDLITKLNETCKKYEKLIENKNISSTSQSLQFNFSHHPSTNNDFTNSANTSKNFLTKQ